MKTLGKYYFRAGVISGETRQWGATHRSLQAAQSEAIALAARLMGGARAIVEWWGRHHGLRPRMDVAAGIVCYVDGQWSGLNERKYDN